MKKTLSLLRLWCAAPMCAWLCAWAGHAHAQPLNTDSLVEQVRRFVTSQLAASGRPRVEVIAGRPDARLRLAPCEQAQPYLPGGARLWGKTRVGLRCVKGVTPWNIYLPVTVNVYGPALVSTAALPAGHVLSANDVRQAEVNLAEDLMNPLVTDPEMLIGRTLTRALSPGQGVRSNSLKARQWFAAGDKVRIRAAGSGFSIAGAGDAVTAGMEGRPARVRTESGRVVSGMPVADGLLEITL